MSHLNKSLKLTTQETTDGVKVGEKGESFCTVGGKGN